MRSKAPVFVLGCPRSGTTLLYHMLLSSGSFAVYQTESEAFGLLGRRFGNLKHRGNRQRLLDIWFRSKLFRRSGLERQEIEQRILEECRNAGDFLRLLMETVARKQGVERWAETTPEHLLYLPLVKKLIPEALIIHVIRDGRDVALPLDKIGWVRPLPGDRHRSLVVAALFWKWMVERGRRYGRAMASDYMEVRYERLVTSPRETLAELGCFVEHELDYERIQRVALGSVRSPNSSFKNSEGKDLSPVGRWKAILPATEAALIENAIGDLLQELEYPLATSVGKAAPAFRARLMRAVYPAVFGAKFWLKSSTPLGRFARMNRIIIADEAAPVDGHANVA